MFNSSQRGQKIILNQTKPVLVLTLVKSFCWQSIRQTYFGREIEWVVFNAVPSFFLLHFTTNKGDYSISVTVIFSATMRLTINLSFSLLGGDYFS